MTPPFQPQVTPWPIEHRPSQGSSPPSSAKIHEKWKSYMDAEHPTPDEEQKQGQLSDLVRRIMENNFHKHSHGLRGSHVKSLAFLLGTLTVSNPLPPYLRHGLFIQPGRSYRVAARFSSEASQIEDDKENGVRGLGVKVFDVVGPGIGGQIVHTQDLLFNSLPVSQFRDLDTALEIWSEREKHWNDAQAFRDAMSRRPDADIQSAPSRRPNVHVATLTLYSQAAYRYGPWVCKFSLAPVSRSQKPMASGRPLASTSKFTAHRELIRSYCRSHSLTYTLRAQFCSDFEKQPVEDASKEWSEDEAPWIDLAELSFPPQESYGDAMRVWWEDHIALCSWHGLEDHRPLGSLNRARKLSYERSREDRARRNCVDVTFPSSFDEVPLE